MSDRPHPTLPDLTEGWPDQAGNDELARLGKDLFGHSPALPQIALDRIQVRMRQEMNRSWWSRGTPTIVAVLVVAVAISLGAYGWLRIAGQRVAPPVNAATSTQTPPVRERYEVTLPPTAPTAPDRPLIDLRRYDDLFKKEHK